jgi:hypothetical protein
MKQWILLFLLVVANVISPKWKLKYILKDSPICIQIKGRHTDDSLSMLLKDTLNKMGVALISPEKSRELVSQFFANVTEDMKRSSVANSPNFQRDFSRAQEETMARGLPASQKLTIEYAPANDSTINIESCDSIGFSYTKLPFDRVSTQKIRFFWSIKQIGYRNADSVLGFLLKKL